MTAILAAWAAIPDWFKKALLWALVVLIIIVSFRLWLVEHDKAVQAQARTGYVMAAILAKSEALRIKAENDAKFNAQAADAARKQADNSVVELQQQKDKYDADVKADTSVGDPAVTNSDIEWLRKR